MPRWSKLLLSIVGAVILILSVGVALAWTRLPQLAAWAATRATGRTVTVGALDLAPGGWTHFTVRDVRMANAPGGTRPDMATLAEASGEIALGPLLHGRIMARDVHVRGADLLLEKIDGQPNWRNGPRQPPSPGDGRASFPTILGATVQGVITFRTSSGHALVTRLDGVRIEAPDPAAPARITGPGSYQGVDVVLALLLGSYDQLHDAAQPFPADITLTAGATSIHFKGTMTDPLGVDGAKGTLSVIAPTPDVLERVAGADPAPAPPLRLEGPFTHDGPVWSLESIEGTLGDAAIGDGHLRFTEGAPTPDKIDTALRFDRVDLDKLLAAFGSGGSGGKGGLAPSPHPDTEVEATLDAAGLTYGTWSFAKPSLRVLIEPGLLAAKVASPDLLGGRVELDATMRGDALEATLAGTALDASALRRELGAGSLVLTGRMDVQAVAEGQGETVDAALAKAHTLAVATMKGGSVSAQLVELAATDVAGLFRSARAAVPLRCLLLVADMRGEAAQLGPVRLRSAAGTITARGRVDLARQAMDLVVASEASTTGALALDVPVRVSGAMDDPSIAPAGSGAGRAAIDGRIPSDLPAPLRRMAEASACSR